MTQLSTKIKLYANREIDFLKDVRLQDNSDGKGVFIAEWNLDIPKPTMAQLDAYEAQANTYEQNLINEQQNKETNKQSAISKLKALGLNDAEIKAITGI
jgi:signal transduction protein with GAF and PtsI domain